MKVVGNGFDNPVGALVPGYETENGDVKRFITASRIGIPVLNPFGMNLGSSAP